MPYFYGLLFKYEWKVVAAIVFGLFILVNVMVSVQPMVDLGTELVVEEARHRARFMAKEIVDRNAALLAKNAEIRADTGSFEREPGVRQVVLVDLENRIIAPAARQGEYFTRGDAARYVVSMRKEFNDGRSTGASRVMDDNSVVAVEPLLVVDPRVGKNKVAALGVVSIDTEAANPAFTRLGTSYADTMTRSAIFALIALFILYRLTLKPFQVLNEDIDRVLRGEMSQVTHEFKIEELDSLWAVINSALTRIPRSGNAAASGMDAGGGFSGGDSDPSVPFREIAMIASFPSVVLDAEGRITYLNHAFEELANARLDDIRGKAVSESFGDGIPEYIDALMRRVAAGEHGASISMDTSNGSFQLHGSAVVSAGVPKAWMFSAIRAGG
jgi:PAS domain-containing protein